jgi:hypothetical protein
VDRKIDNLFNSVLAYMWDEEVDQPPLQGVQQLQDLAA